VAVKVVWRAAARLRRWLDIRQPPESIVFGGAAILLGLLTGGGVWLFKRLIDGVTLLAFGVIGQRLGLLGHWTIFLVPVLGGLVVGLLMHRLVGEERHHGVAGIIAATALAGGRLNYRTMPAKVTGAAISIGAGASVGPEDPSVQIGANVGSLLGQVLHLSDERMRSLVAAGAAGGIAAAFNAPIAGVFFSLEVILGEISSSAFGVTVLAAVTSAVLTQAISGTEPAFSVPPYPFQSVAELPLYLALGLLAGPVAALYVRLLYEAQDVFQRIAAPKWAKPALAGALVGLVGIWLPGVFGVGYGVIGAILDGKVVLGMTLALLVAKLILTPVSIGGGFPGGVFAPALFIGATLGSSFGAIAARLFPALGIAPPALAMVGMAAVLAGAVHAPLTAVILLFEMTNDYRIILPLLFAVAVSLAISRRLAPDSVYMLGLARKGIRLERGRDVDVLDSLPVSQAMSKVAHTVLDTDTILEAGRAFERTHHHGMPVLDEHGRLVGVLTLQDLERAGGGDPEGILVGDVCTREVLTAYPDESIGSALRRMSVRDVGRLPVVERQHPRRLVGILTRADVIRAYDLAAVQRAAHRQTGGQVRLTAFSGATTEAFRVVPGSQAAGKRVADVAWPANCVLATIRRRSEVIIPHGDTVICEGDVVVAVLGADAVGPVRGLLT
jgi:chloride channel protein, CIC family